jgi:hypothetical protein
MRARAVSFRCENHADPGRQAGRAETLRADRFNTQGARTLVDECSRGSRLALTLRPKKTRGISSMPLLLSPNFTSVPPRDLTRKPIGRSGGAEVRLTSSSVRRSSSSLPASSLSSLTCELL